MALDYYMCDYSYAEPPKVTGLKNMVRLPTYADFGHDDYLIADERGYETLVYHLASQFLKTDHKGTIVDPRLMLNKVVRQIENSSNDVVVTTEDGKTYKADYVMVSHFEKEYLGQNILLVTITDDESRRIEKQADSKTKTEVMEVLKKMFGNDIPEATDILVPRWWSNRFYKGSFSNWPVHFTKYEFDQIKAPVGRVYFTGEHTSEQHNGYVHGAYLAGIDSANDMIDCFKKDSFNQAKG
ncbi:hypothetical protein J5N97_001476 [Dioscorea zingiberensis]|uniref:Amine oxidase domain-containing protein n=1 Tax=Dioscorea zingiberensis TaxID=325984 RepID=A0A9D5H285_9LILI|nr:hypothetical protein J5N97_001476 [Dioscorea zingiberensis]